MNNKSIVDVLERTMELLAMPGKWSKGHMYVRDMTLGSVDHGKVISYCAMGAVTQAMNELHEEYDAADVEAVYDAIERGLGEYMPSEQEKKSSALCAIACFNDRVETTLEDVLLVMKRAIHHGNQPGN